MRGSSGAWVLGVTLAMAGTASARDIVVTEADGTPAAKVAVWVGLRTNDVTRVVTLSSGFDGRATLPAGDADEVWAVAWRAGFVALARSFAVDEGPLALRLEPAAETSGRVVDGNGKPLAGAVVSVRTLCARMTPGRLPRPEAAPPAVPPFACTTDEQGQWRLVCAADLGSTRLNIAAEGYATAGVAARASQQVTLVPGGTLLGRVVDAQGRGRPDMMVVVGGAYRAGGPPILRTAGDGSFRVDGMAPGEVALWTAGSADGCTCLPQHAQVRAGAETRVPDLVLRPGVVVRGELRSHTGDQPFQGAAVTVRRPDDKLALARARTDRQGRFQVVVPPGKASVAGELPAVDSGFTVHGAETWFLQLEAVLGQTVAPVTLRADRSCYACGTVVDEQGRPVPGARVFAAGWPDLFTEPSDAAGRYHSNAIGASDGRVCRIVARMDRPDGTRLEQVREVALRRGFATGVDFMLRPVQVPLVRGRVVAEDGRPLAGAQIHIEPRGQVQSATEMVSWGQRWDVTTDADGRYLVRDIPAGLLLGVTAALDGYGLVQRASLLHTQPVSDVPDLRLHRLDGTVAGRVVDADGRPVTGATVFVEGWMDGEPTLTGPNGAFAMARTPRGAISLVAQRGRREWGKAAARAGDSALAVKLVAHSASPDPEADRLRALELFHAAWLAPGVSQAVGLATRLDPTVAFGWLPECRDEQARSELVCDALLALAEQHDTRLADLLPELERLRLFSQRAQAAGAVVPVLVPTHRAAAVALVARLWALAPTGVGDYQSFLGSMYLLPALAAVEHRETRPLLRRLLDAPTVVWSEEAQRGGRLTDSTKQSLLVGLVGRLAFRVDLADEAMAALGPSARGAAASLLSGLARRDPRAAGERLLRLPLPTSRNPLGDPWVVVPYLLAPRLARLDPQAALAIVAKMPPPLMAPSDEPRDRAGTYAAIAAATAAEQPDLARRCLRLALDSAPAPATRARVAALAVGLDPPLAERLDAVLWGELGPRPCAALAWLARLDPNRARLQAEQLLTRWRRDGNTLGVATPLSVASILVVFDPDRAVAVLGEGGETVEGYALSELARRLAGLPDERALQ